MPKSKTKVTLTKVKVNRTGQSSVPICNQVEFDYISSHVEQALGIAEESVNITLRKIAAVVDHLIVKQQRGEWP